MPPGIGYPRSQKDSDALHQFLADLFNIPATPARTGQDAGDIVHGQGNTAYPQGAMEAPIEPAIAEINRPKLKVGIGGSNAPHAEEFAGPGGLDIPTPVAPNEFADLESPTTNFTGNKGMRGSEVSPDVAQAARASVAQNKQIDQGGSFFTDLNPISSLVPNIGSNQAAAITPPPPTPQRPTSNVGAFPDATANPAAQATVTPTDGMNPILSALLATLNDMTGTDFETSKNQQKARAEGYDSPLMNTILQMMGIGRFGGSMGVKGMGRLMRGKPGSKKTMDEISAISRKAKQSPKIQRAAGRAKATREDRDVSESFFGGP